MRPASRAVSERESNVTHSSPSSTHPAWCDPRLCETGDWEVHHRSAPVVVTLTDAVWELQLVATDENGRPGGPELLVSLTDTPTVRDEGSTYLLPEEIPELIQGLTQVYWRMVPLRAPVAHDAGAVA